MSDDADGSGAELLHTLQRAAREANATDNYAAFWALQIAIDVHLGISIDADLARVRKYLTGKGNAP